MHCRIENALPGRESFDVEIYGMEGVPEADLAEWRSRRAGASSNGGGPAFKRQKVENVALTPEQLKAQLEAHKALMSGKAPPPGAVAGQFNPPIAGFPPPHHMMMFPPTGPPPGFGVRPPPIYNRPPPGFGPPPSMSPPLQGPPGQYAGPPPGFNTPPPPIVAPPRPLPPSAPVPNISLPTINPHQEAVKAGAKSRMVYVDITMSPEEKLASTSKYLYIDPEDAKQTVQQIPASSANQYHGPPPGFGAVPNCSVGSPYTGSPHSPYNSLQQQQQSGAYYGSNTPTQAPPGPPAGINYSTDPSHAHAQSYPAMSAGDLEPASNNPEVHTAEALARANQSVGLGVQREVDMGQMESQAKANREQDMGLSPEPVVLTEATSPSQPSNGQATVKQGRARAADLF